jgi:hypothetical protein
MAGRPTAQSEGQVEGSAEERLEEQRDRDRAVDGPRGLDRQDGDSATASEDDTAPAAASSREDDASDDERLEPGRYQLDKNYQDAAGYGPAPGESSGGFGQESGAFAENDEAQPDTEAP